VSLDRSQWVHLGQPLFAVGYEKDRVRQFGRSARKVPLNFKDSPSRVRRPTSCKHTSIRGSEHGDPQHPVSIT
jgi:hypothetical protein